MTGDVEEVLVVFADGLRAILGDDLVAAYVSGSTVSGAFNPASSDVDFLVVTDEPVGGPSVQRLSALHRDLASRHRCGNRLEGAYAGRTQLRPWGIDGVVAAIEPGRPLEAGVPAKHGPGTMLGIRQSGRALAGPPPATVIPDVDAATLERGVGGYLEELVDRADRTYAPTVEDAAAWLLDVARSLYTLAHRRLATKHEAARWLAADEPRLEPALAAALAVRAGSADDDAARLLVSSYGDVRADVRRLAGR